MFAWKEYCPVPICKSKKKIALISKDKYRKVLIEKVKRIINKRLEKNNVALVMVQDQIISIRTHDYFSGSQIFQRTDFF